MVAAGAVRARGEREAPKGLALGIMDWMHTFDTQRREPAPGDEVDADRQDLSSCAEINARTCQGLGMPSAASNNWFCMLGPLLPRLDCTVQRAPSRVRFAELRPPLTTRVGRFSSNPTHSDFKRGQDFDGLWRIIRLVKFLSCGNTTGSTLQAVVAQRGCLPSQRPSPEVLRPT